MARVTADPDAKDLFLREAGTPPPLEMFVRRAAPNESHFYARGLAPADFGDVFSREILDLDVLVYRIPPDLLRPDLWEPHTKDAEDAVRHKMGGLLVRAEDAWTLLWRADRAEPGRLLKEGLDAPAELLEGYILRTTGKGLSALARAWDGRGRFEWAGLRGLPREIPRDVLDGVHADLARMRVLIPEEAFLFASQDGDSRAVFTRTEHLHRAIAALVRGYVSNLARTALSGLNREVCEQLARLADGMGLSSSPWRDFADKGRTIEVTARPGRTPWSAAPRPGQEPLSGPERVLLDDDRTSGLWAVSS